MQLTPDTPEFMGRGTIVRGKIVIVKPQRILVVGAGHVGLYAALRLSKKLRAARGRSHRRRPAAAHDLPAVPARGGGRQHLAPPQRGAAAPGAEATATSLAGEVTRIEHARKTATVQPIVGPPREVAYDHIVVAPGSVSRTLPIPGLREHAVGFKTIGEAIYLRNHVLDRLDVAATTTDPATRQRGADLRLRRRRLRRHRGAGRDGGHGARRAALLPGARAGRHALGAGRGDPADPARGRPGHGRLHGGAAAQARHGHPAGHPAGVLCGRRREALRRRQLRRPTRSSGPPASSPPDARRRPTCPATTAAGSPACRRCRWSTRDGARASRAPGAPATAPPCRTSPPAARRRSARRARSTPYARPCGSPTTSAR